MSFSFYLAYKPTYQRRYGACAICRQGIVAGAPIMLGTGYFRKQLVKTHNHYDCWLAEVAVRAKDWYFANAFVPKKMVPEKAAKLNRLRAKRSYIRQKGGEPNETIAKLMKVEGEIALVKAS